MTVVECPWKWQPHPSHYWADPRGAVWQCAGKREERAEEL